MWTVKPDDNIKDVRLLACTVPKDYILFLLRTLKECTNVKVVFNVADGPECCMNTLESLAFEQWCEHSYEGVLAYESSGRILFANQWLQDLFELPAMPQTTEALYLKVSALIPDMGSVLMTDPSAGNIKWGSLRIKKYQPKQITWQRIPVTDNGIPQGTLVIFRDATTHGLAEPSKQSFLSMISHDLRTPLSTILGFAELLFNNRSSFTEDEQNEFLAHIIKNANQLNRYAQIALDVMYLEADLQNFETQVVSLGKFVSRWLADASHRLSATQIVFSNGYVNDPQALVAPSAMHRILSILAEFALAESPPNSPVNIQIRFDDALAHVVVELHAPTLAAGDVPDLFRMMQPRDLSEKGRPQLHRMQLYVANLLAERQKGFLTVNDKGGSVYALDIAMLLTANTA